MANTKNSNDTVKVRFNFDTVLSTEDESREIHGRKLKVQNFYATEVAKKGEIRDLDRDYAKELFERQTYVPVGSGVCTQRMNISDFMPDKYVRRIELVE